MRRFLWRNINTNLVEEHQHRRRTWPCEVRLPWFVENSANWRLPRAGIAFDGDNSNLVYPRGDCRHGFVYAVMAG